MSVRPRATSGAIAFLVLSAAILAGILAASPVQASIHHHRWQAAARTVRWTDPDKDAALVADGGTGRILYSRNADALRHPASLTKMMTLYLLFEQLKNGQMTLATPIPVSEHAAIQSPTKLHVRPGTSVPVETAIKSLVVLSANDMAVAISEAIGGTESHFAELMTAKARALGMMHTFYHNASGLPDELQITTASDLAILARHLAYDFPQYFHYFSTPSFTYAGITHFTHDNLIGRYDGADGIKTGYTNASGFNLVSSVVRNGAHVIGVVMGGVTARRRDAEMMRMLDTTFASISQNPRLVARTSVPWQTMASNTPAAPIIAGFQIAGTLPAPTAQSNQVVTDLPVRAAPSGADDEESAESRPDPELDAQVEAQVLSPTIKAPPAAVASSPPNPSPPAVSAPASPAPVPVDITRVDLAPPPAASALKPAAAPPDIARVVLAPPPAALPLKPAAAPTVAVLPPPAAIPHVTALLPAAPLPAAPLPKPRPMLLAAYQPPQTLPTIVPKPREALPPPVKPAPAVVKSDAPVANTGAAEWAIQIGAFADATLAKAQLAAYAERSMDVLGQAARQVTPFQSSDGHTLFRARFGPFPEREAREVCQRLTERGQTCFAALAQR